MEGFKSNGKRSKNKCASVFHREMLKEGFAFQSENTAGSAPPENILNASPTGTVISYWTWIYYNRDLIRYFTTAEQGRQLQCSCYP